RPWAGRSRASDDRHRPLALAAGVLAARADGGGSKPDVRHPARTQSTDRLRRHRAEPRLPLSLARRVQIQRRGRPGANHRAAGEKRTGVCHNVGRSGTALPLGRAALAVPRPRVAIARATPRNESGYAGGVRVTIAAVLCCAMTTASAGAAPATIPKP